MIFCRCCTGMREILIKNMVCRHCIEAVRNVMMQAGFGVVDVELGKAVVDAGIDDGDFERKLEKVDVLLHEQGFERIVDNDAYIVEKTKHAVLEHVRMKNECRLNLSACIESHLGMSYDSVSRVFSRVEGRTVEKYQIALKIEYVKELLSDTSLTIADVAFKAGYSSSAHLSRQFKEVTGMTPTEYQNSSRDRRPLNEV